MTYQFTIHELQPVGIVMLHAFRDLNKDLKLNCAVMDRNNIRVRIGNKNNLQAKLVAILKN